ncbi:MAG: phage holin family protein [Chloroflexi bacterium]|nr:phage holin family protein [Chloroflexota bacterium]
MITCPWCGTNYTTFRNNCQNCGGPLPLPAKEKAAPPSVPDVPEPPPAPRAFKESFVWRKLLADGWAIAAGVFLLLGVIFTLVGIPLVMMIVGIPFLILGPLFLGAGVPILIWRHKQAQQTLNVLRIGEPALGVIVDVYQNYNVRVNERNPWTVRYSFEVDDREYEGKTTTLRPVGFTHQPAQPTYVLYLETDPAQNTIYPPVM